MSLINKKGNQVIESLEEPEQEQVDFKELYIRLKDKESIVVRLLSSEDFVSYKAHASGFGLGIYPTVCLAPLGKECPLCKANKYAYDNKIENEAKGTKVTERYLVAMVDLEKDKIRLWDCSKGQVKGFIEDLEDYKEMVDDGEEIYFKFSRSGNGKETKYSLKPILVPKQQKEVKAKYSSVYAKYDGMEVKEEDFEKGLFVKSANKIVEDLKAKGLQSACIFESEKEEFTEAYNNDDGEEIPF